MSGLGEDEEIMMDDDDDQMLPPVPEFVPVKGPLVLVVDKWQPFARAYAKAKASPYTSGDITDEDLNALIEDPDVSGVDLARLRLERERRAMTKVFDKLNPDDVKRLLEKYRYNARVAQQNKRMKEEERHRNAMRKNMPSFAPREEIYMSPEEIRFRGVSDADLLELEKESNDQWAAIELERRAAAKSKAGAKKFGY
jgi:hypothetical protein